MNNKYFAINFNFLGLKKLITTSYSGMFTSKKAKQSKQAYKIIINETKDFSNDDIPDTNCF